MEFLNGLGLTSTLGFFGLALLVIGGFMILAGVGIISIQQVTVKQGRATWVVGLLIAGAGVILLYPDLSTPDKVPENVAVLDTDDGAVVDTEPATVMEMTPTAALSTSDSSGELPEWKAIEFVVPENGLWREEDGRYTATGSRDTIAWSEDLFEGDIEMSFEIESSNSNSAANVILYGNGGSLAPGNLVFTVASVHQSILADSIYDNGAYLFSSMSRLSFGEKKYSVLISVIDRRASLFLDGEEIASAFLDEKINNSGRIGLLKYWEIQDITFSNILVRESVK